MNKKIIITILIVSAITGGAIAKIHSKIEAETVINDGSDLSNCQLNNDCDQPIY